MKKKILTLTIGAAALAFAGCESTTNSNVNLRNVNDNTAVVTTATPTPANSNANRWSNANNVNRADYDRDRADYERDRGDSRIGTGANDSWLWFKTRAALLATDDLRESTINVDVDNAVVTLRGTVANKAQSDRAEQTAKGIEGVSRVTNQLKVSANDSMTNQMVNGTDDTRSNANRK